MKLLLYRRCLPLLACTLLFIVSAVLATSSRTSTRAANSGPTFKIGYLLPEYGETVGSQSTIGNNSYYLTTSLLTTPLDYYAFNKHVCPEKLSALDTAVNFASKKLRTLFRSLYGCDFELDRASTKVSYYISKT
jgi:hypothetical protein